MQFGRVANPIVFYAGILAGIWPCGIITLLDELFRAEAKSQVYGSIHSFLNANPSETSDISECPLL